LWRHPCVLCLDRCGCALPASSLAQAAVSVGCYCWLGDTPPRLWYHGSALGYQAGVQSGHLVYAASAGCHHRLFTGSRRGCADNGNGGAWRGHSPLAAAGTCWRVLWRAWLVFAGRRLTRATYRRSCPCWLLHVYLLASWPPSQSIMTMTETRPDWTKFPEATGRRRFLACGLDRAFLY
jgi:hypothetical protein